MLAHSIRALNLTEKELKLIAKSRDIKGYKRMSKDELLSSINASRPIKSNKTIKEIRNLCRLKIKTIMNL